MNACKLCSMVMILLATTWLASCATSRPFAVDGIDMALTPRDAVDALGAALGKNVLWGGVIVNSRNLEQHTQLEVLAYPLDERQRPLTSRDPVGRFIADHAGYLETVDYAPGRTITLSGTLTGSKEGKIDGAVYVYPAVAITQLQLWPKPQEETETRFQFGIGIFMHN